MSILGVYKQMRSFQACSSAPRRTAAVDIKKGAEEYREYLEKNGIFESLAQGLAALYDERDKPNDALGFLKKNFAGHAANVAQLRAVKTENGLLKRKVETLEKEKILLKERHSKTEAKLKAENRQLKQKVDEEKSLMDQLLKAEARLKRDNGELAEALTKVNSQLKAALEAADDNAKEEPPLKRRSIEKKKTELEVAKDNVMETEEAALKHEGKALDTNPATTPEPEKKAASPAKSPRKTKKASPAKSARALERTEENAKDEPPLKRRSLEVAFVERKEEVAMAEEVMESEDTAKPEEKMPETSLAAASESEKDPITIMPLNAPNPTSNINSAGSPETTINDVKIPQTAMNDPAEEDNDEYETTLADKKGMETEDAPKPDGKSLSTASEPEKVYNTTTFPVAPPNSPAKSVELSKETASLAESPLAAMLARSLSQHAKEEEEKADNERAISPAESAELSKETASLVKSPLAAMLARSLSEQEEKTNNDEDKSKQVTKSAEAAVEEKTDGIEEEAMDTEDTHKLADTKMAAASEPKMADSPIESVEPSMPASPVKSKQITGPKESLKVKEGEPANEEERTKEEHVIDESKTAQKPVEALAGEKKEELGVDNTEKEVTMETDVSKPEGKSQDADEAAVAEPEKAKVENAKEDPKPIEPIVEVANEKKNEETEVAKAEAMETGDGSKVGEEYKDSDETLSEPKKAASPIKMLDTSMSVKCVDPMFKSMQAAEVELAEKEEKKMENVEHQVEAAAEEKKEVTEVANADKVMETEDDSKPEEEYQSSDEAASPMKSLETSKSVSPVKSEEPPKHTTSLINSLLMTENKRDMEEKMTEKNVKDDQAEKLVEAAFEEKKEEIEVAKSEEKAMETEDASEPKERSQDTDETVYLENENATSPNKSLEPSRPVKPVTPVKQTTNPFEMLQENEKDEQETVQEQKEEPDVAKAEEASETENASNPEEKYQNTDKSSDIPKKFTIMRFCTQARKDLKLSRRIRGEGI